MSRPRRPVTDDRLVPVDEVGEVGKVGKVDEAVAREVAAAFVNAPSRPGDPVVGAAYAQLEVQADRLLQWLTQESDRPRFRVVYTRNHEAYSSDHEMIEAARTTLLIEICTAAADRDRSHPLMSCAVGGAYDRFRAVHDLVGHVIPGLGFDRHGEYSAWLLQSEMHRGLGRWALATELHGEHSVCWTTGELADHKAVLLGPGLLRRSARASRCACARSSRTRGMTA